MRVKIRPQSVVSPNAKVIKPPNYWNEQQNVINYLGEIREKYKLRTEEDWNSLTQKQIMSLGGATLLKKNSLYDLKCIGYPEGKFKKPQNPKPIGYWENKKNIIQILKEISEKYNLNTIEDWSSLNQKQIKSSGYGTILSKYSMYEIKCMACPEGKLYFRSENKPLKYWENKNNVIEFLNQIKEKYNLKSPYDWNVLTQKQIQSSGGRSLFQKYSMYDLKCIGCEEGKLIFNKTNFSIPSKFWKNEINRNDFLEKLKLYYNLKTIDDWKRLSFKQIKSQGGIWLFYNNMQYLNHCKVNFEVNHGDNVKVISKSLYELIKSNYKRSSQRWLFLQIQKLFPGEEIVEDYFHSALSRVNGSPIQFDIFIINKNIAIEYHGQHHYDDLPSQFGTAEMYKERDLEKKILCSKYGIRLVIIPYWWDNNIDSLKITLCQ